MNEKRKLFIGEETIITDSANETLIGIKGRIIDETKHTFKIQTKEKIKTVLKKNSTFKIRNKEIKGETIEKKPQDRIKSKDRK